MRSSLGRPRHKLSPLLVWRGVIKERLKIARLQR